MIAAGTPKLIEGSNVSSSVLARRANDERTSWLAWVPDSVHVSGSDANEITRWVLEV